MVGPHRRSVPTLLCSISPIVSPVEPGAALAFAVSARASAAWSDAAAHWLRTAGFDAQRVADTPGLVVARTIAMLINEAADAVQQGVCTRRRRRCGDEARRQLPGRAFRVAVSAGTCDRVIALLEALDAHYRGERYRVSPELRRRAWRAA